MKELVTSEILQKTCEHLAGIWHDDMGFDHKAVQVLDDLQLDLCKNLLYTGGRYADIARLSQVVDESANYFFIQGSKGGNIFHVHKDDLTANWKARVSNNLEIYPTARPASFRMWINRALAPWTYTAGDKNISVHLFRYNFVTQLHNNGEPDEVIQERIGEKSKTNMRGYYLNPIYREKIEY